MNSNHSDLRVAVVSDIPTAKRWEFVDKLITLGLAAAQSSGNPYKNEELAGEDKVAGAYIIFVVKTKQIYIGSSGDLARRKRAHRHMLNHGVHSNPHLRELSSIDPNLQFIFLTLLTDSKESAKDLEQDLLDKYSGNPRMLNISIDAERHQAGLKRSPEHRANLSKIRRNPEVNAKYSNASKAAWQDPKKRAHLLAANQAKGKPIIINNVEYPSTSEASKQLGINKFTIQYRLNSAHFPTWRRK